MASTRVKVSTLILAAQTIALVTFLTGPARSGAAATPTFQASVDFSSEQGYRGWSYRDSTGALLTYDGTHLLWRGSEAYLELWRNGGHPGATRGARSRSSSGSTTAASLPPGTRIRWSSTSSAVSSAASLPSPATVCAARWRSSLASCAACAAG